MELNEYINTYGTKVKLEKHYLEIKSKNIQKMHTNSKILHESFKKQK